MTLRNGYTWAVALGLICMASIAVLRRGVEPSRPPQLERVELASRPLTAEPRAERATPMVTARPGAAASAPAAAVPGAEAMAAEPPPPVRTWDGKHLRDYTWEERQATGLTNEKLFAFAGAVHWGVLADELGGVVDASLLEDIKALEVAYRDAGVPYAYEETELNVSDEQKLLGRLEPLLKLDELSEPARRSYEFLQKHSRMWETGEAQELVDQKIERDDDEAKLFALSQRGKDASPDESGDED